MSKYDKLISDKEQVIKDEMEKDKERQRDILEKRKTNREIANKILQDIVLPEFVELQNSLQKNARKVELNLNEHTIEGHKSKILVGIKLLVIHPRVSPGLFLEFSITNGEDKFALNKLIGSRAESSKREYAFNAITPVLVQRIIEEFVVGLYE